VALLIGFTAHLGPLGVTPARAEPLDPPAVPTAPTPASEVPPAASASPAPGSEVPPAARTAEAAAGAPWILRDPERWPAPWRALVDDTWASLPVALRVPLVLEAVAMPSRGDPNALDTLVTVGRGFRPVVRVAIPNVAPAGAADPLRRALVHAAAHVADRRAGWSRSRRWRSFSGWSLFGGPAAEHDTGAYADPAGQRSAAEDLATTVTATFDAVATPPADPRHDPRCRTPSKVRFVTEVIGPVPSRACDTLADVGLDPARIDSIEIVYATGSAASVASLAGHLLVAVRYRPDAAGVVRADAYGLVAMTDGTTEGSPAYILRGLSGGFPSRIVRTPLDAVVQHYTDVDDRDVRRYTLRLDPAQQARLLARLEELRQGWDRPYLYVTRNCTLLPAELIAAALDEDLHPPSPLTPDVLLGMLDRRGLLAPVPLTRPDEVAIGARALAAERLRAAEARTLGAALPALVPALRDARAPAITRRIAAYGALGAAATDDRATLRSLDLFLAWSDAVEQDRLHEDTGAGDDPAVEAIRGAKAALRRRAIALGAPAGTFGSGQAALRGAVDVPRDGMGDHTPLRTLGVWTRVEPAGPAWFGVETALYHSSIGEPRRYSIGASAGFTVLETAWAVSTDARLRVSGALGHMERVDPTVSGVAPGVYLDLLAVDAWEPVARVGRARLAEGGGIVALWPGKEGGVLAWLSAGVALDADGQPEADPGALFGAAVPVGLLVRLDSRRETLTGLSLRARAAPRLGFDGAWSARGEGILEGRLRLGVVAGADVGVRAAARVDTAGAFADPLDAWPWTPSLEVGLRMERF
jgi:hypothetical protein